MSNKKPYSSRTADKFVLRLLDDMRQQIKEIADASHRSMNSEMIAWLETMLEIHAETGVIPTLANMRSGAEMEAQNRLMRAIFQRLLEAGSWHMSAVEFDSHDHHVDGLQFEKEIKEVLAQAVPKIRNVVQQVEPPTLEISEHYSVPFDKLEALLKTLPKPYGPDYLPPVPQFIPQEGMPVFVSSVGRNGVVRHIWIGGDNKIQKTMARVEMYAVGCVQVPACDLCAPKP